MERLDDFFMLIDYILVNSRRKRIVSGILLSIGILFVSLSLTLMTIKTVEENDYE